VPSLSLLTDAVFDNIVLYAFNVAHPIPPTNLIATYTTDASNRNTRLIKLEWTAPALMPDVVSYNVYRNGEKVANVPIPTSGTPVYFDAVSGGEVDYFTYYVTAVDVTGTESLVSTSITNFSQKLERYIYTLREDLKDNPPDPRVQRWSDCQLLLSLKRAISRVNAIPMTTTFNFDTLPEDLYNYVLVAARLAALRSQASVEAAKEFSMGVGGVSININRSGIYNTLISSEESAWQKEMENIKRYFTMRTVFGEGLVSSPLPFRIRTYSGRQYRIR